MQKAANNFIASVLQQKHVLNVWARRLNDKGYCATCYSSILALISLAIISDGEGEVKICFFLKLW